MGWCLMKCMVFVLLFFHQIQGCECCIEEERIALLELKAFLVSNDEESEHMLPSWIDDSKSDCCHWERVSCSLISGHVEELKLGGLRKASISQLSVYEPLLLNVSLFRPFVELLSLDLSENILTCCVDNEGFERLSSLKKLERLNLAINYMETFPESIGGLTSLKRLNLSDIAGGGQFPVQELSTLTNLETLDISGNDYSSSNLTKGFELLAKLRKLQHLDLSNNYINNNIFRFLGALSDLEYLSLESNELKGPIPSQDLYSLNNLEVLILRKNELNGTFPFQDLMSCKNLKILDLSLNSFAGRIPPNIGALSSLRALSFAENQFNGSLPVPGICELKKLQELDLSSNSLEGTLPECLANLSSLTVLDFSMNRFSGSISASLISSLLSLEYIHLGHNRFEHSFPFSSFANHSRLAIVDFGNNTKLEVETEYPLWNPKFQLEVLMLSNCILNKPRGDIPKFLLHQYKLKVVDLSHNNLTGNFPSWLLQNVSMLQVLSLRNNSLNGQINLPTSPWGSISWMDLSSNSFDGQLQQNLGNIFPNVTYLNLSRNAFEGNIPASLCAMSSLHRLDLSFNNLSGEVPKQLVGGCVNLDILKLSGNNFHGQILSSHFNLTELSVLHLDGNKFSGAISDVLSRSSRLVKFDVGDNFMSGEIPKWSSKNMTSLESVIMRNNFFRGHLPDLSTIQFLDLSNNFLSGALPSWPDLQFLMHMHLQGNKFNGSIPENFLNLSSLLTLDIRDNNFSGSIPTTIDAASNLRVLLLSGNRLSGSIPNQLCKLEKISLMDLSNNLLSGSIPFCFKEIAFGKIGASDRVFMKRAILVWSAPAIGNYGNLLRRMFILQQHLQDMDNTYNEEDEVEFITKSRHSSYKGDILNFMSGLDLSCNNLTGEIPSELGELAWMHALNFSHNHLVGSIPKSFSKLEQIESLDLSHNSLTGEIPSELTDLNFLGVFSVAYNFLSGRIPNTKAQFGTFENSSYEGNPFLCGPPLRNCTSGSGYESPPSATTKTEKADSKWYDIDPVVFFASFTASYTIFLIGVVTLLYINPYLRQRLVYYCEEFMYSCYYCYSDIQHKLRCCFRRRQPYIET